ncbi:MAG: hypothetical protein ACQEXB_14120 [Bacillota bacterium]
MNREKEIIKQKLDDELRYVKFTRQEDVRNRINPVTWKNKLSSFLNKEFEVPLMPIFTAVTLLFLSWGIWKFTNENDPQPLLSQKELVEAGGNIYWKDQLERAVVLHEN